MAAKIYFLGFFVSIVICDVIALKLTQVVVVGRHNVRTPLTSKLERFTLKIWPQWKEEVGFLTAKGALLESYMAEFFSAWLKSEGLLEDCPSEETVYIYANARQRTIESARVFADTAFKDCNITVHFKENVIIDPVFLPVIHNTTKSFKDQVVSEIQRKLDGLELTDVFLLLNEILNLSNSPMCKENSVCDLSELKDNIVYKVGEEPNTDGALHIGNAIADAFLMALYSGLPLKKIAFGNITPNSWETFTTLTKEDLNVRFNYTDLGKDLSKPLINLINQLFVSEKHKFTLLVGHDSTISSLIAAIGFKHFELKDQYEITPVGSKLVFQKWYDEVTDNYNLKVDYIYQTTKQLRYGTKLSLENPPNSVQLELKDCIVDKKGFCPWNKFLDIMAALQ